MKNFFQIFTSFQNHKTKFMMKNRHVCHFVQTQYLKKRLHQALYQNLCFNFMKLLLFCFQMSPMQNS